MANKQKCQSWFISIGWNVAIKSSLLSLGLTLAIFFYMQHYLDENLKKEIQDIQLQDQHQFEQLRNAHFDIQLGFIETLSLAKTSTLAVSFEQLTAIIDASWHSLNFLNGIEAMSIYDRQGKLLKKYGDHHATSNPETILSVATSGYPENHIACEEHCHHIFVAPFLIAGNDNVVLSWQTTSASLLQAFALITNTTASLVASNQSTQHIAFLSDNHHFSPEDFLSLSQHLKNKHHLNNISVYNGKHLSLSELLLEHKDEHSLSLFWVRDVSPAVAKAKSTLQTSLWVMALAGVLLFSLIIILLQSLTRRSHRLAKILPLLIESKFDEAETQLLSFNNKRIFHDEIDRLINTSLTVTRQLKSLNQQLHNLAYKDSLTHLPNRQSLYEALDLQLRQISRHKDYLGLLFIDIDGFKAINDSYGHKAGDFILTKMAAQTSAALRQADTLFRLAGDEFVIMVTDLNNEQGLKLTAQKVINSMEQAFVFEGHSLQVSLSVGGVMSQNSQIKADLLLNKADEAMYLSKQAGKGRYTFHGIL